MQATRPMYMNVYRDKDGLTYSCFEFDEDTQGLFTLDDVKADIYSALVYKRGQYVCTLSNDGENYTPIMKKFAEQMELAINNARVYDIDPKICEWYEIEQEVAEAAPAYKAHHFVDRGETYFTFKG